MKMLRMTLWALAAAGACCLATGASGGQDAGSVVDDELAKLGLKGTGDANTSEAAADDLAKLLENMSTEDIQKLIKTAIVSRLTVERAQAAEEIKGDLLSEPDDIDKAIKIIEAKPTNTQKDNIDRILRGYAVVDLRLGRAAKLLADKKYAEAAETIKKDLNVQEATYRNAARYMVYGRALAAAGKSYDAVDAYQNILVSMADRISFAAAAAMESARIYDERQRFTYAAQMYDYAMRNYGLTLDDDTLDKVAAKLKEYDAFRTDPLGWAANGMGDVKKRLDSGDSGKDTQKKEEQIVAVITDLIKTAEEQQRSSQSPSQKKDQKKDKKKGEGEGQGDSQAQGKGQGDPKGTNQPSSPAKVSAVVPGAVARPTKRSQVHAGSESGDWANLPPRERQKLEQLRKKVMSERYRVIIGKYRAKVAEGGSE
jgi:tetratricopeptide (TPR) repeat protein